MIPAGAEFAWEELLAGEIANAHARRNDLQVVRTFLNWCDHPDRQIPLGRVTPSDVGTDWLLRTHPQMLNAINLHVRGFYFTLSLPFP